MSFRLLVVTVMATVASAQTLNFYFNYAGEFNCNGAPLDSKPTTTSCLDISGENFLSKPWSALKAVNLGGCQGKLVSTTLSYDCGTD
jgi:hypothetical protein